MKKLFTWGLIMMCGGGALAATPKFSMSPAGVSLQDVGVTMRLPSGMEPMPVAPPAVYTYRNRTTGESFEKSLPRDLWYSGQHLGFWSDDVGNSLSIGKITIPYPDGITAKHVTAEEFKGKIGAEVASGSWDIDALRSWVEAFLEQKCSGAPVKLGGGFKLKNLVSFPLEDNKFAYAFRFKPSARGTVSEHWFFVYFNLESNYDFKRTKRTIEDKFLKSIEPIAIKEGRNTRVNRSFQNRNKSDDSDRSDEYLASKKRVIDSIRNVRDWWYVETENYLIVSSLGTRDRKVVKRLQTDIEYMHSAYKQFMPPPGGINAVSVLRIFADAEEYEAYVGASMKWSGGAWISSRRELVIRPVTRSMGKQDLNRVLDVMYHEAFHQYLFYSYFGKNSSTWFNEGHAELFEKAEVDRKRLTVGENGQHVATLESLSRKKKLNPRPVLYMSVNDFYCTLDNDSDRRSTHYAIAWGIVYYLRKGVPLDKDSPYSNVLETYAQTLWETGDGSIATDMAFEGIDMDQFQKDLSQFWRSKTARSGASRNRIFKDFKSGK